MEAASTQTGPWTVARLLEWTRDYFKKHGVDSPRLSAEILLGKALGCERIHLYTQIELVPTDSQLAGFRDAIRKVAAGKPIAYLTGTKEFFSLSFDVTPDVLIPRPETEILVERCIDLARKSDGAHRRIVDIGAGSGCIVIALARHLPGVELFASDISPAALAVARRNAEKHGVAARIDFRQGDLLGPWQDRHAAGAAGPSASQTFDIIVSNPPYVALRDREKLPPNVRDHEPHSALFAGEDGLLIIERLLEQAPAHLRPGGALLMEIAHDQASAVREMLRPPAWEQVVAFRDSANIERVIQARLQLKEE